MNTSTKFVVSSVLAVVCYTVFNLIITAKTGTTPDATLTTCWFGFWTVEIVSLATIKNTKTKKGKKKKQEDINNVDNNT